jgi:hypothetical protein
MLRKSGMYSWTTSVENKMEMELFLFGGASQHASLVTFVELKDRSNKTFGAVSSFDIRILASLSIRPNKKIPL